VESLVREAMPEHPDFEIAINEDRLRHGCLNETPFASLAHACSVPARWRDDTTMSGRTVASVELTPVQPLVVAARDGHHDQPGL
jgi:hypothetical protein